MTSNQFTQEIDSISKQIHYIQSKLKTFPKGDIVCTRNGKYTKWFKSNGKNPIYLPKNERGLAEKLAAKKYYTNLLGELNRQLFLMKKFHDGSQKNVSKSFEMLEKTSPYCELLESYFANEASKVGEQNVLDYGVTWSQAEYFHNESFPEHLKHKTSAKHYVRSKSEVSIANALYTHGIQYRYECGVELDGYTFFPDFTILSPRTKKIVYWEHFGMMDEPTYVDKTTSKLNVYAKNGIIPTMNLITTYETKDEPLDIDLVNRRICENFL